MNAYTEEIENMDSLDKLSVYMDYYVTSLALNKDIAMFIVGQNGWGESEVPHKHIGYTHLHRFKIASFEAFCSNTDEKQTCNIYYWYWRFAVRIFGREAASKL